MTMVCMNCRSLVDEDRQKDGAHAVCGETLSDLGELMAAKVWSHTAMETIKRCPHRYLAQYIFGEPELDVGENLGSALHEAILKYSKQCFRQGRSTDYDYAEFLSF